MTTFILLYLLISGIFYNAFIYDISSHFGVKEYLKKETYEIILDGMPRGVKIASAVFSVGVIFHEGMLRLISWTL